MTRQEFVSFLEDLKSDFDTNKENWENKTLDSYLEAMSRYANDIQGYYDNTGQRVNADEPNWKTFSDILKGASLYE